MLCVLHFAKAQHCCAFAKCKTLWQHINIIKLWDPDGRLSPREWELSWPIAVVAPEVAVDDKWAVPRDLLAYPILLISLLEQAADRAETAATDGLVSENISV